MLEREKKSNSQNDMRKSHHDSDVLESPGICVSTVMNLELTEVIWKVVKAKYIKQLTLGDTM